MYHSNLGLRVIKKKKKKMWSCLPRLRFTLLCIIYCQVFLVSVVARRRSWLVCSGARRSWLVCRARRSVRRCLPRLRFQALGVAVLLCSKYALTDSVACRGYGLGFSFYRLLFIMNCQVPRLRFGFQLLSFMIHYELSSVPGWCVVCSVQCAGCSV